MARYRGGAYTDAGDSDDSNEDSFLVRTDVGIFAVADGMGGGERGDLASRLFIETLEEAADSLAELGASGDALDDPRHRERVLHKLTSIFLEANRRIYNDGQGEMGTTAAAVVLTARGAFVAHVGDARVFRVRDGAPKRLTTDHTYAEQTDAPTYQTEEFEHVLTRSIGPEPHVEVDTVFLEPAPDDVFLLCTDGATHPLDRTQIRAALGGALPEEMAEKLVVRSRTAGGDDDATALGCGFAESPARDFDVPDSVDTTKKLELLREVGIFEGIEPRNLLRLLRHVFTAEFESGEALIERNSSDGTMYVVVSGEATVRREGSELARVGPGESVGEMALLDEREHSADVVAEQPLRALRIGRDDFEEMVHSNPDIGNRILTNMLRQCVDRLRRTTDQLLVERREPADESDPS